MDKLLADKFIINRLKNLDYFLISLILTMVAIGIILLYSAAQGDMERWALKQLYTSLLFIPLMIGISLMNIKFFYNSAYFLYFIGIVLLIVAEVLGHKAMGAQRWIRIGFINFQPSELMKIFIIIALARYFHRLQLRDIGNVFNLIIPMLIILIPVALVLKQPNLGTASIIILISASILFCAGIRWWKIITVVITALICMPLVWSFIHDYQKKRILTFLNPESDPLGAGYNIIQSLIAIGSGESFGKGFMGGSQSQLDFLPEKQTDFIFTILAEEFGFLGVLSVFAICMLIIARCFLLGMSNKNQFSRLVILGIIAMFSFHIIINTAMIAGMIPVVGTPFPLLSYGGSNLITMLLGFGIILCTVHSKNQLTLK
jgi:rod shape determining protein RodA